MPPASAPQPFLQAAGSPSLSHLPSGTSSVTPDPDCSDIHRVSIDHLAFGHAAHGRAGQSPTRIGAHALFGPLLRRVERIELVSEPIRHRSPLVRGPEHLLVTVTSRPGGMT